MGAALVIHPDGEIVEVNLNEGADHLALKREHLDCHLVDCVALTRRLDMWIDDEGIYTQPVNPVATALAVHHGFDFQPYHGPVLLCGVGPGGESVDLNTDQIRGLLIQLLDVAEVLK